MKLHLHYRKWCKLPMKHYILLFMLLTCHPFLSGAQEKKKPISAYDDKTLLTYGLRNIIHVAAENTIAAKWDLQVIPVAGCIVTSEITDSVERHNNIVIQRMENQYGKDWKKEFDKSIEAEEDRRVILYQTVNNIRFIKRKIKKLKRADTRLSFYMQPIDQTNEYLVYAQAMNAQKQWTTYYKMKVNYKSKTYTLLYNIEQPAN